MIDYYDCMISANKTMMVLVLLNCCYLFRKCAYSSELDFRQILIDYLKFSPNQSLVMTMKKGVFSTFHPVSISSYDATLYTGLRALKLNK